MNAITTEQMPLMKVNGRLNRSSASHSVFTLGLMA